MQFLSIIGGAIVTTVALVLLIEGFLRILAWFKKKFLVQEVRRKDFLAKEYHDYINRVEDWSKPMFKYVPLGLRLFNLDNPIPGRVTNNSLGFRCREFNPPNPDILRIALLGGSAAWGSGASTNDATIAGQLEQMINQDARLLGSRKKAECYNLAQINGYQTQDILTLLFFCPQIKPDIIVSFTGWNELVALETMKREILEKYRVFYMSEMEGWKPVGVGGNKTKLLKNALSAWGNQHFELIKRLTQINRQKTHSRHTPITEMIQVGSELFRQHLQIIQTISRAYSVPHFQFMQPYLYRKKTLTAAEQKVVHLYDDLRPVHGGKETGKYLRENNVYLPLLQVIQAQPKLFGTVEDLSDMFRDETDTMFYTLVHLTDTGYHRVAKAIYNTLIKTLICSSTV